MAYDLHITRRNDWADTDGDEITREEWVSYLAIDKTLELDRDMAAARDPAVASGAKEPDLAVWLDWPGRVPGETEAVIQLLRGNLTSSDPDQAMRRKLFLVADALNARLQGDKGEIYNSIGEPEGRARLTADGRRKRWWKFW